MKNPCDQCHWLKKVFCIIECTKHFIYRNTRNHFTLDTSIDSPDGSFIYPCSLCSYREEGGEYPCELCTMFPGGE